MAVDLVSVYLHQRDNAVDGSIYKATQCDFAYNSNKIEGSKLTHDQTVMLWDLDMIDGLARRDDVVETGNHFVAFDRMLDTVRDPISEDLLKELNYILLAGTSKGANPSYAIGEYKRFENVIEYGGAEVAVASPADAPRFVSELIGEYESRRVIGLDEVLDFHVRLERIHPFADGNGRVGRLLMFKECLRHGVVPFVLTDDLRAFYLRGLSKWERERGWLRDTCGTAQDRFEASYLPLAESYAQIMAEPSSQDLNQRLSGLPRNPAYPEEVRTISSGR